ENHRAELFGKDLILQGAERAVSTVDPDACSGRPEQVAAARAVATRTAVGPRAPEDGQLHDQASTSPSSGPRKRSPNARNVSTGPLVMKRRAATVSVESVRRASRSRTAKAVSSALDTSTTSRPMTSPMVRARSG